jgi:tyrosyl-tRNA synthetase
MENGMSFTEFSYQLVQGYDYLFLFQNMNCKLQMGGSDQWGNIVTGTELIRRKVGCEAYALTTPLIAKADGTKFGKTESGNVWLDPKKTSPYKFYQFWLNASDADVTRYIRIFTLFKKDEIEAMEAEHNKAPHLRLLQKALAKDITIRVHSEEDYNTAVDASEILFGKSTTDMLKKLDEDTLLSVFEGVPMSDISQKDIAQGIPVIDFISEKTNITTSKSEARRMLKEGSISINKAKVDENYTVTENDLLNKLYILVQKGKKNYYLVKAQ